MGYTKRKIRGINNSFFLAGLMFAGWALFSAWFGLPRSFPGASKVGFILFAAAAIFFTVFPVVWARFPDKHPVNHELRRYGKLQDMSARLDAEMAGPVEILGPFRFTATLLVYDSAYEFNIVPYDQIVAVDLASDEGNPAVIVRTRRGRTYHWFRTLMQGTFDPEKVREKIHAVVPANDCTPRPSVKD
jgi:hypothetical protein